MSPDHHVKYKRSIEHCAHTTTPLLLSFAFCFYFTWVWTRRKPVKLFFKLFHWSERYMKCQGRLLCDSNLSTIVCFSSRTKTVTPQECRCVPENSQELKSHLSFISYKTSLFSASCLWVKHFWMQHYHPILWKAIFMKSLSTASFSCCHQG